MKVMKVKDLIKLLEGKEEFNVYVYDMGCRCYPEPEQYTLNISEEINDDESKIIFTTGNSIKREEN